jgi:broad specificity phosphatase PhoE
VAAPIYLIRHGETQWTLTGQHTSHTDVPLTERGEQQARHLGTLLHGLAFDQVLVSPLQRARRTCELAGLGAAARVEPNLREWDYGDYEGQTPADIRTQRPGWDVFQHGCPGGESAEQVSARVDGVVAELGRMDGRVVLFSHGHLLRALAVRWILLPIRHGRHLDLDPASLSVLTYEHNNVAAPALSLWNAVSNEVFELVPRQLSSEAAGNS